MPERPCPACDGALSPLDLGDGTSVDTCDRCRGAFFAKGALARTLGARDDLRGPVPDDAPARHPCPACETVLMQRVPFAPGSPLTLDRCPYCEGVFARLEDLPAMRAIPEAPRPRPAPAPATPPREPAPSYTPRVYDPDAPDFAPLSLRQRALALPIAAGVAVALHHVTLAKIVLGGARIPLHELGHATAAWLSGYSAVPIPFGVTWIGRGRSVAVYLVVAAGLALGAWRLVRARAFGWAGLFVALLVAQGAMTWSLREPARQLAIVFGGSAGEMLFASLLLVLFFARLPSRLRWDQARWIALAIGAFILVDKTLDWRAARLDDDLIPWGSVMGEDGDMQRLERDHGWTPWHISTRYAHLAHACCALVAGAWLASLAGWWRRRGA